MVQHSWTSLGKTFIRGPNQALTRTLLHLQRKKLRRVTALINGHRTFRKHLQSMGLFQRDPIGKLGKQRIETHCSNMGHRKETNSTLRILDTTSINEFTIGMKALDPLKNTKLEFL